MGKGQGKGSDFERTVCRDLSKWWSTDGDTDVLFWRTASSGGRATNNTKKGKSTTQAHCGDICALDARGAQLTQLITFELKRGYTSAILHALLDRSDSAACQEYESWINQAVASSQSAKTPHWAIIHKRNQRETILTCPSALLAQCIGHKAEFLCPCLRIVYKGKGWAYPLEMSSLPFDLFLKHVTPLHIISAVTLTRPKSQT